MNLLLLEDDLKMAKYLVKGLQQEGFSVEFTSDGKTAIDLVRTKPFAVAIFDLMLPGGLDGLEVINSLRRAGQKIPILILSAKNSAPDRVQGLVLGADDYLPKPFSFQELVARLRALVRRAGEFSPSARLKVADLELDRLSQSVTRRGEKIELQPLEFSLLRYLMENVGQIVSKSMIREQVWKFNFDPRTNIVETRMCKLREKIERAGDQKLLHTVWGVGYVLREER